MGGEWERVRRRREGGGEDWKGERKRRKRKTRVLETGTNLRLSINHYQICNKNVEGRKEGGREGKRQRDSENKKIEEMIEKEENERKY